MSPSELGNSINVGIELISANHLEPAEAHFRQLLSLMPYAPAVHGYLAWSLYLQHNVVEALPYAREAVVLSPRSENASMILLQVLVQTGDVEGACDELRRYCQGTQSPLHSRFLRDALTALVYLRKREEENGSEGEKGTGEKKSNREKSNRDSFE